jgi:antitoxin component YwqK of YwqJK toxin-antitoxin module
VNGDVTKFSDDSTVLEKETYAAGRKLHTKIEYHDAEGKSKKQEVSFLEAPLTVDKPDNWGAGTLATFKMEGKGERHGQYRIWYANGQLAREGEFCHDQPCGKITTWYPNGQPQLEGLYAEGHQEGSWTWWFENGQKATSGEYRQGEAVGSWSWWTSAGKVVRRTDLPRSRTIENLSPESGGEIREAKVQPKQGMGLPLR